MTTIGPTVRSSDGVDVATYDLGGGGRHLLVAHATGFHGRCYLPLAEAIGGDLHVVSFDFRGHGDTPRPDGVPHVWPRIADDAEAVAVALGAPLVGFGHSMGGACLLLVAHRHPELFERLVLFEPIVFGPGAGGGDDSPLSVGARRRRARFPSYEAAIENYSGKPPLSSFTPAALDAYVRFGFADDADGVQLKCAPELEAATFEAAAGSGVWDLLGQIAVPTVVICGNADAMAASLARPVAERLPQGRYVELPDLDHFAPMNQPSTVAELIGMAMR